MRYKTKEKEFEAIQFTRFNMNKALKFTNHALSNVTIERHPGSIMKGYILQDNEKTIIFEDQYITKESNGTLGILTEEEFKSGNYEKIN